MERMPGIRLGWQAGSAANQVHPAGLFLLVVPADLLRGVLVGGRRIIDAVAPIDFRTGKQGTADQPHPARPQVREPDHVGPMFPRWLVNGGKSQITAFQGHIRQIQMRIDNQHARNGKN